MPAAQRAIKPSDTPCASCGEEGYETHFIEEALAEMRRRGGVCHTCNFWMEVVERKAEHVVVKGVAWFPKPDDPALRARTGGWGLGLGGVSRYLQFKDGTILKCSNLWCRGHVPLLFRDKLPDNAEFVTQEAWEILDPSLRRTGGVAA